jgi:ferric-dicitrate binding protein FerR (iron transport regulator)
MSARPSESRALAEMLREHAPLPDDLARARMEQRVLASMGERRPRRRSMRAVFAGGAVALAAAAAIAIVLLSEPSPPSAPVARFERHDASASIERGTLEEGSSLRTEANEIAELRAVDSRVRVEGASRLRIATLARDHLALELDAGAERVAFHPRERGREHVTIETPSARVEVVGTVFRVEVRGGDTHVSVSEGTVRVVPLGGGAPRLVHAGQETRVEEQARSGPSDEPTAAIEPEPQPETEPASASSSPAIEQGEAARASDVERAGDTREPAESAPAEREERAPVDPRAALAEASRLIGARHTARAMPILRELTRPNVPASIRTEAWLRIGDVSERADRLRQAARAYEHAERVGRGTSQAHNAIFALARLQDRRLHDADAARASYERYLTQAPEGALASQARTALCRLGVTERCER